MWAAAPSERCRVPSAAWMELGERSNRGCSECVDVIDCSSIDQNVHNLRHNYYMLNTQMVEDVCELIGGRITAPYRQRLSQVEGNIFNFIAPPRHITEMV